MIPEEDINNKLKSRKGFLTSDSTGESSKKVLPEWNSLYAEMEVKDMPWYLPELDPDLRESLVANHILSGSFLDLGTGPGTQAIGLSKMGFEVTDKIKLNIKDHREISTAILKHKDYISIQTLAGELNLLPEVLNNSGTKFVEIDNTIQTTIHIEKMN